MGERSGDDGQEAFRRVRSSPTPPEDGGRRGPVPPPGPVRRRRFALLLAGTMSVLVLLASGTAWAITGWVSGQMSRFDVFGTLGDRPDAGPTGALNFLVIGSDSREGMDGAAQSDLGVGSAEGRRSDTMMLVHLNEQRDALTVVGIPRDSWVDVPGEGKDKINAAYAYGGPQLAVETVEASTSVRIDHYVEIDFGGFVDVVDALGGIEVCLPEAISDEKAKLDMSAGTHTVDGSEALAFARTRQTEGGDLDRIDRQQQVIAALLESAMSSDTLSDPDRFATFLETALGTVTVDEGLDTATINELGGQLRSIGLDDVTFTTVPIEDPAYTTPRGDSAVLWDRPEAAGLFQRITKDQPLEGGAGDGEKAGGEGGGSSQPPAPGEVTVQVFNGIGTPGIGGEAAAGLTDQGFDVPGQAQNWSSRDVETTIVRHAPNEEAAAKLVARTLPGAELEEDDTLRNEVQVVLGFDFTAVEPLPASVREAPASPSDPESGPGQEAKTARDNVCS